MGPFTGDLERLAEQNDDFRHVLYTGMHSQLVAMRVTAGEEIGQERHEVDQIFIVIEGLAEFEIDDRLHEVEEDGVVIVPAGSLHNVTNIGEDELRLLTIYAPAQHKPGTVHRTKADALRAELVLQK